MNKAGLTYGLLLLLLPIYFYACGLEQEYYLPQVPLSNIESRLNTEVDITLDNLTSDYGVYSPGYSIFYKIYISDQHFEAQILQANMKGINSTLESDFNSFLPFTDPTNYASLPNANTFRNRYYHELELNGINITSMLTGNGGSFNIFFPLVSGEYPRMTDQATGATAYLFRNSGTGNNNGIFFTPKPDRFFTYSFDLVNETDYPILPAGGINNDVSLKGNLKIDIGFAYVSMYIVAVGVGGNFSRILSKPTHIGVFKLP